MQWAMSPLLGLDPHIEGQRLQVWDPVTADYPRTGGESEKNLLEERAKRLKWGEPGRMLKHKPGASPKTQRRQPGGRVGIAGC